MPDTVTYNQTEIPKEEFVKGLLDHLNLTDEEKNNSEYLKPKPDAIPIQSPDAVPVQPASGHSKEVGGGNPKRKGTTGKSPEVQNKEEVPTGPGPGAATTTGGVDYHAGKIITSDPEKIQIATHYRPIVSPDGAVYSSDGKRLIGHMAPGEFNPYTKGELLPDDLAFLHGLSVLPNSNPVLNSWNEGTYGRGNIKVGLWLEDQSGVHPYVNTIEQTKAQ